MADQYLTIEHLPLKDIARIFGKIAVSPKTGCWEWQGARQKKAGYGFVKMQGKQQYAHRVMYAWLVGQLPRGRALQLDHYECDNKRCCNPVHLKLVTAAANSTRDNNGVSSVNARKTHCIHGHEFTPENTRIVRGQRACRECIRNCARARRCRPEVKAQRRLQVRKYKPLTDEQKARQRERVKAYRLSHPEFVEKCRAYDKARYQDPAVRARKKERDRIRWQGKSKKKVEE